MAKKKKSQAELSFERGEPMNVTSITDKGAVQLSSIDTDDTIENMFRNEQNSMQNDVKELFSEDRVKARTDISMRQIKLITKAYYMAQITEMPEIHGLLKDFLLLSISKDRKSRQEFVQGLQSRLDNGMLQAQAQARAQFGK